MVVKQITFNVTPKQRTIDYIVIHDTGNKSSGANAKMHFDFFNSADRQSSADFFVDSSGVTQVNDYRLNYTWHCGDGSGKYGITNQNSIGVEICINADGNFDATIKNAIDLVRALKREFPNVQVVRHYDASRKLCPASLSGNNWVKWEEFKKAVSVLNWKEILQKVSTDPVTWETSINVAVAAAKADGNLGALEVFQWLPDLIEKVYNSK